MFLKNYTYFKIFSTITIFIFLFSGVNAQTVTKTYNPAGSTCYDGNGNYGTAVGSVNYSATDFTGCNITELDVIIRWSKSDGGCPNPTLNGNSFHAETSFKIVGPTGVEVILVRPGAYSTGNNIYYVTTRFNQGSTAVSGTPTTGTFGPNNGNLDNFNGTNPVGNWTLYAGDNSGADPLIVDYFQVVATSSGGQPAAQGFGCGQWNVNAYRGRDWNLGGGTTMYGYYTESNLSFNTLNRWASNSTPASASGYVGCDPGIDNHTIVSKRTCFPCANYQIDVPNHDDESILFRNGAQIWSHNGCCDAHNNVWSGVLENSTTLEMRHAEGTGGSNHGLTLTDITATLNSGSHATNTVTACVGADYGNLNANAASGGTTSSITGGSTTYQWQLSYNGGGYSNIGGATSEDYNIPALNTIGTYDYRRRVTDRCGNTAFTNSRRYNIVEDPSISLTVTPTTVCPGEGAVLTATPAGGTGTCNHIWQSSPDNIVWTTIATNTSTAYNVGTVTATTYFRVQRDCNGFGCNTPNSNVVSVTVEDNIDPVIVGCPTNINVNNTIGSCGTNVSWTEPTATDNCTPSTYRTNGIDFTLLGIYNGKYYYISDNTLTPANGSAAAQQAAVVSANQAGLNIGGSLVDINDAAENAFLTSVISGSVLIGYTDELTEGNFGWFSGASNTYDNWNAGEPNNAGGEDYTELSTSGQWNDINISTSARRFIIETATVPPTVFNNNFDPGDFFPVGTTTVTYTADDGNGNTATCSFNVTVNDTESPQISCPANIMVNNDSGICGAVVNYTAPVGTDNCSGQTTALFSGLASGSTFPLGNSTVTYRVTDAAGNTSDCSFTITVTDAENPQISCPANITANSDAGICGAVVTYTAPVGTDNCPGQTTALFSGLASGSTFPVGNSTVTYRVTDTAGNTTNCSFTITIVDVENPQISCPSNIIADSDAGICGAVITYTAPTGTDNCPGQTTALITGLPSGSIFPVGTTTNTFRVTDAAGNTADCSFTVTINDIESPQITCPPDATGIALIGVCEAIVTYTLPTTADNCSGSLTLIQTAGLASGSNFPVGNTINTFEVTDAAGNTATCSFNVDVSLDGAPLDLVLTSPIVCVGDGILASQSGGSPVQGSNPGDNGTYAGLGVTDNPNGTFDFDPTASGTGTHTISYTYDDGGGCILFITKEIEVFDSPIASLTCPDPSLRDCEGPFNCNPTDLNLETIAIVSGSVSGSAAQYTYGDPNPGGDFFIDFPNMPTDTPLELIYTVTTTDGCSNSTTCTFEIIGKQANAGKY